MVDTLIKFFHKASKHKTIVNSTSIMDNVFFIKQ